jgi:hypothetical protein
MFRVPYNMWQSIIKKMSHLKDYFTSNDKDNNITTGRDLLFLVTLGHSNRYAWDPNSIRMLYINVLLIAKNFRLAMEESFNSECKQSILNGKFECPRHFLSISRWHWYFMQSLQCPFSLTTPVSFFCLRSYRSFQTDKVVFQFQDLLRGVGWGTRLQVMHLCT